MSPSESDLRAALHDGEGRGGLNVDHLIQHAQATAAQRRVRLMSGAAIVAVVLGTGVGIGYLAGSSGSSGGSDNSAGDAGAAKQPGTSAYGEARSAAHGNVAAPSAQVPCPATFPDYRPPGGGGLNQFGADGPLFSKPVASVVVCAYGKTTDRVDLDGAQAADLAASLENAATTPTKHYCPDITTVRDLAIVGVAANGARAGTVSAKLNNAMCDIQVTNGTAVRYNWSPPRDLRRLLLKLTG